MEEVTVVGGGLAGTECAYQLAERGIPVRLVEQKPKKRTPAQQGDKLAELVCSNSLRGDALTNAVGLLKEEMRRSGSLILAAAEKARVPAGGALAVDREIFSDEITALIDAHPLITRVSEEVLSVPTEGLCVLATGPLTGDALAEDLARLVGHDHLAYYDAIAPVVTADSLDWEKVFKASRYDKGDADYVNCPMNETEYYAFVEAVVQSEKVVPHGFEKVRYFEGCLPVEVMAERGPLTLAHGPMKPVGLKDPRTGQQPFAVVQLRLEDAGGTAYNLVGFQTRMKWPEQKRVFRMIPGLENAEFERLGSVHRNTFVNSPKVLNDSLALNARPTVYLAGQVTGVEGYVESAACGFVVGTTLGQRLNETSVVFPPETTALGALTRHLRRPHADFQPSNVVWSMFPPLEGSKRRMPKRKKHEALAHRALAALGEWHTAIGLESRADQFCESAQEPNHEQA